MIERVRSIGARFCIEGKFVSACPHGRGHIHDTFAVEYAEAGKPTRYLVQRLNTRVFGDPAALCDNIVRITDHLRQKLDASGVPDRERRCLDVIEARDARPFCVDEAGDYWRAFRFIERTETRDTIRDPRQAYRAARAFGGFAVDIADLPGPPLAVTIPDFHNLAHRFAQLQNAASGDIAGRAAGVAADIESASRAYENLQRALAEAGCSALPRRVMHNDCKLDNVLLDAETGECLCVIDLDTVMDGTVLCDFGELVRSGTCRSPEDVRNLAAMAFDDELFGALSEGYLAGTGRFLDEAERRALPLAGPTLTLENAIRFLADHLSGDVYFRTHRAGHNLDRARAHLRLVELMSGRLDTARRAVEAASAAVRKSP